MSVSESLNRTAGGHEIRGDVDLAKYLLEVGHVATVPGEAFGAPGFIRISYATSMDRLTEGMKRIRSAIAELKPL